MIPTDAGFLSGDWGTTALRLRWIGGPGGREVRSDDGAGRLAGSASDRPAAFRSALLRARRALGAPDDLPVVLSGMAGSSIGWKELPYATLPFPLDGSSVNWERLEAGVLLLSGLRSPGDMMRGEETQALGLAAILGPELPPRASLILPGTHSKHLDLSDGAVVGFRTHMTGELYDVLSRHSVLRHSVDADGSSRSGAFADGVEAGRSSPVTEGLFRVRTRQVLGGHPPADNGAYLSGFLIGAELATVPPGDRPVLLAADGALGEAYRRAAGLLGLGSRLRWMPAAPLAARGQRVVLHWIATLPG